MTSCAEGDSSTLVKDLDGDMLGTWEATPSQFSPAARRNVRLWGHPLRWLMMGDWECLGFLSVFRKQQAGNVWLRWFHLLHSAILTPADPSNCASCYFKCLASVCHDHTCRSHIVLIQTCHVRSCMILKVGASYRCHPRTDHHIRVTKL